MITLALIVAMKRRNYSNADQDFVSNQIKKLLVDDIIEPSSSPLRAQVDGNEKMTTIIENACVLTTVEPKTNILSWLRVHLLPCKVL